MAEIYYIGLEINEKEVRMCQYDKIKKDAETVMIRAGGSYSEMPAHMAYVKENDQWKYGIEADFFAEQKGCVLFDDILGHCMSGRGFEADGVTHSCEEVVCEMLRQALLLAGLKDIQRQIAVLVVTVPKINKLLTGIVNKAFDMLGLVREQAYIQSFDESFFAHTFFQKQEVYSRDVGLFCFKGDDEVQYKRLHADQRTKPATVLVCDEAHMILSLADEERDRQFEAFIQENTSGHEFSGFFLVGNGFDRRWAKNSLALLCKAQRKVFYGNNLFARGACFFAYEKAHPSKLKNVLFLGNDLVRKNIGIDMLVDGIAMYYPLINAGVNWYEAKNECELLLNDEESILFRISRMEDGKKMSCAMPLEGLPKRPPKTTRLHISLKFENKDKCVVTVRDMGFGEIFTSSDLVWTDVL